MIRSLIYISILYFVCVECDDQVSSRNDQSNIVADSEKDSNPVARTARDSSNIAIESNNNLLTDEERNARCVLGSRRHLRKGDANQVANYFLKGGPLIGQSHFVGTTNCDSNNDDQKNIVGASTPKKEIRMQPEAYQNDYHYHIDGSNGATMVYSYPHAFYTYPTAFYPYPNNVYRPTSRRLNRYNFPITNALDRLGSILHPPTFKAPKYHAHGLPALPHSWLRTATLPVRNLLNAGTVLGKALTSDLHQEERILKSTNDQAEPKSDRKTNESSIDDTYSTALDQSDVLRSTPESLHSDLVHSPLREPYFVGAPQIPYYHGFPAYEPMTYILRVVPHNAQIAPTLSSSGMPRSSSSTDHDSPVVGATRESAEPKQEESNTEKKDAKKTEGEETRKSDTIDCNPRKSEITKKSVK